MKELSKLNLILGSHAHIPSGARDSEFEYVYENKMRPFVSNLNHYSNIQAVLHYSGVLLYWVERTHPEFFMLIEDMVARKQAEIIGGGFYEPMLPLIPLHDRIGQIEHLTTYIRKHFGKRPAGCWIPGMAWEQNLVTSLASSDMSYTFLSQEQFLQAGLSSDGLFYPCITEEQGKLITVFPVSVATGNLLAEKSSSSVFLEMLNNFKNEKNPLQDKIVCVFPEKAASSTNESVDTVWNRFFEELSLSNDSIETVLPSKILKTLKINKKISFKDSASPENNFSPRRFVLDSCEADGIYSKMIFINMLISQLRGDKIRKQSAREELWKSQDSFLFSPGSWYLRNDLRKTAYSALLRAERLSREKDKFIPSIIQHDFDLDGQKELLFQDTKINCYIRLKGASIFELDFLPKDWNYLDCGGDGNNRRTAFADILSSAVVNEKTFIEELGKGIIEKSRSCYDEYFDFSSQSSKWKSCLKLPANLQTPFGNIEIIKCYSLKRDVLAVNYSLKNTGKEKEDFSLITEINFSFASCSEALRALDTDEYVRFYANEGENDTPVKNYLEKIEALKILDIKNEVQLLLSSSKTFSGLLTPVSKNGMYQAHRIFSLFTLSLEPGEIWENNFSLKFSH